MDAVQVQLDAYNRRDLEAFLSAYAPDVVLEDGAGNAMIRGRDGMRKCFCRQFCR